MLKSTTARRLKYWIALAALLVGAGVHQTALGADSALNVQELIQKIEKSFSVKYTATTPQEAIDASYAALARIQEPSVVVFVSQNGIAKLLEEKFKSGTTGIRNVKVEFDRQIFRISADYQGSLEVASWAVIDVTAAISGVVGPSLKFDDQSSTVVVSLTAKDWDVDIKRLAIRNVSNLPVIDKFAEKSVEALLKLLEAAISRAELQLPTLVSTSVGIKAPESRGGIIYTMEPRQLPLSFKIAGMTHFIEKDRFSIILQEGAGGSQGPPRKGVSYDELRQKFREVVARAEAPWLSQSDFAVYASQALILDTSSKAFASLKAHPVCISASAREAGCGFGPLKIPLPPTSAIECDQQKCSDDTKCKQERNCDSKRECRSNWPSDKVRCEAEKKASEKLCEIEKSKQEKACELARDVRQKACEAKRIVSKTSCEAKKEAYDGLRRGGKDFGLIQGFNTALSGTATLCLEDAAYNMETTTFTAKLSGTANERLNGKIKFTPQGLTGHLACVKAFDNNIDATVKIGPTTISVNAQALVSPTGDRAGIAVSITDKIRLEVNLEAILSQLASNPDFIISCPATETASAVRLFTPDQWWPRSMRGKIDLTVPSFTIEHNFIEKPARIGQLQANGKVVRGKKGMGAHFSLQQPSPTSAPKEQDRPQDKKQSTVPCG